LGGFCFFLGWRGFGMTMDANASRSERSLPERNERRWIPAFAGMTDYIG